MPPKIYLMEAQYQTLNANVLPIIPALCRPGLNIPCRPATKHGWAVLRGSNIMIDGNIAADRLQARRCVAAKVVRLKVVVGSHGDRGVVRSKPEQHVAADAEHVVDEDGVPGRDGVEDARKGQLHALKILSPSVRCCHTHC